LNEANAVVPPLKGIVKEFETNIDAWEKLNGHDSPYDEEFPGTIASSAHFFVKVRQKCSCLYSRN